jgi:hypothetical protein
MSTNDWPIRGSVLSALVLCALAPCTWGQSQEKNAPQQLLAAALLKAVAAESERTVSDYSHSCPNTFQLHAAAQALCSNFNDHEAIAFYKEVAQSSGKRGSLGDAAQLTGTLGLAVLSEKHGTVPFLESMVGEQWGQRPQNAFAAISFLPNSIARNAAEDIMADPNRTFETRIKFLFLLRAVGDKGTLDRLKELPTDASPHVRDVQSRTAEFIRLRLDRKTPAEQERWSRQELVFIQAACHTPGFHSGRMGLAWVPSRFT